MQSSNWISDFFNIYCCIYNLIGRADTSKYLQSDPRILYTSWGSLNSIDCLVNVPNIRQTITVVIYCSNSSQRYQHNNFNLLLYSFSVKYLVHLYFVRNLRLLIWFPPLIVATRITKTIKFLLLRRDNSSPTANNQLQNKPLATDWMSTILLHMAWPLCKFRMQVWNVLHAARCKCRTQKSRQKSPSGHHPTMCRAISSQLRHVSTIRKKIVKQQYLPYMSPQYGELRPISGWDRFVS